MLNRVTRLGGEMLLETTIDPRPGLRGPRALAAGHGEGEDGADLRRAPDRARVDRLARRDRLHATTARRRTRCCCSAGRRTSSRRARTSSRWSGPSGARPGRREPARSLPAVTLAGIVLAAAALWGTLGQQLDVPTVFGDELIHWDASRSLAAGEGSRCATAATASARCIPRCSPRCTCSRPTTSTPTGGRGCSNALVLALAAVPAYFLARRLLPPGWSLACAALDRGAAVGALHGVRDDGVGRVRRVRARVPRDRPLPGTPDASDAQLLALAARRPRGRALGSSSRRSRPRSSLALVVRRPAARRAQRPARAAPATGRCSRCSAVGAVALGVRAALGNPLEGYGDLWRSYDLVEVARWTWRAFAGLGLYLALVPVVVAPAGARRARAARGARASGQPLRSSRCSCA